MLKSSRQSVIFPLDAHVRAHRTIREQSVDIAFHRGGKSAAPATAVRAPRSLDGIRLPSPVTSRKTFVRKNRFDLPLSVGQNDAPAVSELQGGPVHADTADAENKKRTFLKFAGAAGLGAAASLLVPGRAEALVFGSTPTSNVVGLKDSANARIDPAKEGGNLATVKTNTDPLVTAGAGGFVRQDSTATIAKESGGNLASIKTSTDTFVASGAGGFVRQDSTGTIAKETGGNLATLATNVPAKGQALMAASMPVVIASDQGAIPVSGSFSVSAVGIKDATDTQVNPATDDAIVYLRRMVKLMESQATVDVANRQRVTLDAANTTAAVTVAQATAANLLATVSIAAAQTLATVTNITTVAGQNQQMYQDVARNAYANGIRQNLIFS